MKLRDIPGIVLENSTIPLSAREIWNEAVKRGLVKLVGSKGRTPDASIGAFLYTQVKRPQSGIVAEGSKPIRFRLVKTGDQAKPHKEENTGVKTTRNGQGSKFLKLCLEVLEAHAPSAMGVSEIIKEILARHPALPWSNANDAVRAALLRTAGSGNGICKVADSIPPKFFFDMESKPCQDGRQKESEDKATMPITSTFPFLKCAEKVLREFGGKNAMHYRDITKKAIALGWLVSDGATPEATMAAQLATDIIKRSTSGKEPLFIRHRRGYFGLAEWIDPIQADIEKHNARICAALLSNLRTMPPIEAAVLFCKEDTDYMQCLLRLGRFKGKDNQIFIDNKQITGNIFY